MENYRMNCAACRPYNNTCGMNKPCRDRRVEADSMENLPLAMAYVPYQKFSDTFQLNYALSVGTIFPDLCKPFCGRRCLCR